MPDELIDLLDSKGNKTGRTVMRSEAHAKGLWHELVHVLLINQRGELLLQLRSKDKKTFPDLFDVSIGGHIGHGLSPEEVALKEAKEELGINLNKKLLKKLFFVKNVPMQTNDGQRLCDFYHVFLYKLHAEPRFVLQREEVASVKFVKPEIIEEELKNVVAQKKYVPHGEYWFQVLASIQEELKSTAK